VALNAFSDGSNLSVCVYEQHPNLTVAINEEKRSARFLLAQNINFHTEIIHNVPSFVAS